MSIVVGDTVWSRTGLPMRIEYKDPQTGKVLLDKDFNAIQKDSLYGIKNGMFPDTRVDWRDTLNSIQNEDVQQSIKDLFHKILSLKHDKADSRLIKYLENELQFLMVKHRFVPKDYFINPIILSS
jgi:hypothetical protein